MEGNESYYEALVDEEAGGYHLDFNFDIADIGLAAMSEP